MVNILCDPPRLSYISGLLFSRLKGKLVVGNASIFHALSVHSEPGSARSVLRALPIHSPLPEAQWFSFPLYGWRNGRPASEGACLPAP